jgi:hypothetical protein
VWNKPRGTIAEFDPVRRSKGDVLSAEQKEIEMSARMKIARPLALVTAALMVPLLSIPAAARSAMDAYADSKYGYCDAKKIAKVWGGSIEAAKAVIGQKILSNLQSLADTDIASTQNSVHCDWGDTELSYEDAEKLAKVWGRSVEGAKTKATRLVSEMGNKKFRQTMSHELQR